MKKKAQADNGVAEHAPVVVPPRPQAHAVAPVSDPIMEALQTPGSPQLGTGFPPEVPVREVHYNPSRAAHTMWPPQMAPRGNEQDAAVGSLMYAVLNQRRDVGTKFHMLLVPETSPPEVHSYDTVDDLQMAVKSYLGSSTYVFCFLGHALRITKGPFHYLQTPYGSVPLHDIPSVGDDDVVTNGWVGPELPVTEFVRPTADEILDDSGGPDEVLDADDGTWDAVAGDAELVDATDDDDDEVQHDETELF